MRQIAIRGASTMAVLALFYLQIVGALPLWSIIAGVAAVIVYSTVILVWTFINKPPSVERFRALFTSGSVLALCLWLGTTFLLVHFPVIEDPAVQGPVIVISGLAFAVGFGACFVWYFTKIQSYGRWKRKDPDFAEDNDGNPVRPN